MLQFICIFMPAVIMVGIVEKLEETKYDKIEYIIKYALFVCIITTINLIALNYMGNSRYIISNETFTNLFALKYMGLSLGQVIILPIPYLLITRNIGIKLSYKKRTKLLQERNIIQDEETK